MNDIVVSQSGAMQSTARFDELARVTLLGLESTASQNEVGWG